MTLILIKAQAALVSVVLFILQRLVVASVVEFIINCYSHNITIDLCVK